METTLEEKSEISPRTTFRVGSTQDNKSSQSEDEIHAEDTPEKPSQD